MKFSKIYLIFIFIVLFSINQISLCQDSQYQYQDYQYPSYPQKNSVYYNNYRPYYNNRPSVNDYLKGKNVYPSTNLAYRSGFSDFNEVANIATEKVSNIGNEIRSRLKQVENVASNIKKLTNDLTVVTHGVDAVADGNTNIAQRGFFDSGITDVLGLIGGDFAELKDSIVDLLSAIGNDINHIINWVFSFPGFGIWNLTKNFISSFLNLIQLFPRIFVHTFLPKSMESVFRSNKGVGYIPQTDNVVSTT